MRNTLYTNTLLLTLILALFGCGLGTEIGNGFKADGDSNKSGKAAKQSDENRDHPVEASAPEGGEGKGGTSGGASEMPPMSGGADDGNGSGDGDGDSDPNSVDDAAMIAAFDATPLHAACATPFAAGYDAPFHLAVVAGGKKAKVLSISVHEAGKGVVDLLRFGKTEALKRLTPAPVTTPEPWAWSASVNEPSGVAQSETFSCKDKRVETTNLAGVDGDVTKVSVTLVAQDGKETALVWFAKPKTETAKAVLFKIELRAASAPATDGPVVLEAAP